jgi:hypothetical protein
MKTDKITDGLKWQGKRKKNGALKNKKGTKMVLVCTF